MSTEITPETYSRSTDGTDEYIEDETRFILMMTPALPFRRWIDPPIGFDMSGIDSNPNHHYYRVRIMSVGASTSEVEVPLVDFIESSPLTAIPPIWEFQMIGVYLPGVTPVDPAGLRYYKTMSVSQGAPGLRKVRSRIFTPPQLNPSGPHHIDALDLAEVQPAIFRVFGIPGHADVFYKHVKITNSQEGGAGPRHLFLQQPQ